jgi:SAM-dependent methyltransferase
MSDPFYKAFEDHHRGSRSMVKSQLQAYLPFVDAVGVQYPSALALDLKCGRGEWLEILTEAGFEARGVDSEQVMVEVCRQRGLNVQQAEALAALEHYADASQALVSGFQVAEQLPFEDLQKLVKEAVRVLKPGGLLILETPDPENIMVGASYFYLDPRRVKPLPPLLLSYLAKYHGFSKTKILRPRGATKKDEMVSVSLLSVLSALSVSSLNYALIAQKAGAEGSLNFDIEDDAAGRGNELKGLASTFDQKIVELDHKLDVVEKALASIHGSFLWKMTAPIRWAEHQSALLRKHGLLERIGAFASKALKPVVSVGFKTISAHPALYRPCLTVVERLWFYERLRDYVHKVREPIAVTPELKARAEAEAYQTRFKLEYMSTEATVIFDELKAKIRNNGQL